MLIIYISSSEIMLESMKEAYFRSIKETIFMIFSYVRSVDYEEDYCFCDVYSVDIFCLWM